MFGMSEPVKFNENTTPSTVDIKFKPIMTTLVVGVRGPVNGQGFLKEVRIHLHNDKDDKIPFDDELTLNYGTVKYADKNYQEQEIHNLNQLVSSAKYETSKDYITIKFSDAKSNHIVLKPFEGVVFTAVVPPLPYAFGKYKLTIEPIWDEEQNFMFSKPLKLGLAKKEVLPGTKTAFVTYPARVLEYQNWMSFIDPSTKLRDLTIPGAANTGQLDAQTAPGTFFKHHPYIYCTAKQQATVTEMLNAGVRAFDLRPAGNESPAKINYYGYVQEGYYTVDGSSGDARQWFLDEIAKWLDQHEKECVFLYVSPDGAEAMDAGTRHKCMSNIIYNYNINQNFKSDMTLREVAGRIVVFVTKDAGKGNEWLPEDRIAEKGGSLPDGIGYLSARALNWSSQNKPHGEIIGSTKYVGFGVTPGKNDSTYYETVNVWFKSPSKQKQPDEQLYLLRKEFLGKQGDSYLHPTFSVKKPHLMGQVTSTRQYDAYNMMEFKANMVVDMLEAASSTAYKNNWFITFVPSMMYQGNRLADFTYSGETEAKNKGWASLYNIIHGRLYNYLNYNRVDGGRYGVVFTDFVPGIGLMRYADLYGKPDDFDTTTQKLSWDIHKLLINSNFSRGLYFENIISQ